MDLENESPAAVKEADDHTTEGSSLLPATAAAEHGGSASNIEATTVQPPDFHFDDEGTAELSKHADQEDAVGGQQLVEELAATGTTTDPAEIGLVSTRNADVLAEQAATVGQSRAPGQTAGDPGEDAGHAELNSSGAGEEKVAAAGGRSGPGDVGDDKLALLAAHGTVAADQPLLEPAEVRAIGPEAQPAGPTDAAADPSTAPGAAQSSTSAAGGDPTMSRDAGPTSPDFGAHMAAIAATQEDGAEGEGPQQPQPQAAASGASVGGILGSAAGVVHTADGVGADQQQEQEQGQEQQELDGPAEGAQAPGAAAGTGHWVTRHPTDDDQGPLPNPFDEAATAASASSGPASGGGPAVPAPAGTDSDPAHPLPGAGSHGAPPPVPGADGFYDPALFTTTRDGEVQLPPASLPLAHILSLESYKRNNVFYLEDNLVITSAGNNVVFLDLAKGMAQRYLPGLDGGGIGAVAVHPSRKYFAVAEKCRSRPPNVYVYQHPGSKLLKVLRNGTEHAYSALAFNGRGDMLASVGGYPDYLLTLWNWQDESILLRSKAFSQDVYSVKFSPSFEGFLTTSGTGHIRFWKMATTFTGLKLQGQIGKFGAVELSDVSAFVEMPDGKVLSGTETGNMLMWDGGLIKVVLVRAGGGPCHAGAIEVLQHHQAANVVLSGGADGYVRLWDFAKINDAEADEDSNSLSVEPMDEVLIAPGARVKTLTWERGHWLILDEAGALYKVTLPAAGALSSGVTVEHLLRFHSGGIVGLLTSPVSHHAITAGRDGSVRVFDYRQRKLVHTLLFPRSSATCFTALPPLVDPASVLFVAGFKEGVVRMVLRCEDGLRLQAVFKPHKAAVTAVAVSPDGRRLATCSDDNTVFFFILEHGPRGPHHGSSSAAAVELIPECYAPVVGAGSTATWSADGTRLLIGSKSGSVFEVTAPASVVDTNRTYETELVNRQYAFKLPKVKRLKKKEEEGGDADAEDANKAITTERHEGDAGASVAGGDRGGKEAAGADGSTAGTNADGADEDAGRGAEEEDSEEECPFEEAATYEVLSLQYVPGGSEDFYLTLGGRAAGRVWQCSFDSPVPLPAIPSLPAASTTYFGYSRSGLFALFGTADGIVRVQKTEAPFGLPMGQYWEAPLHDMLGGRVSAVAMAYDDTAVLSAAKDGSLYLSDVRLQGVVAAPPPAHLPLPLLSALLALPPVVDITDPASYTIEEAKQKAEQDLLVEVAEAKKMGVRDYLAKIRAEFEELLAENAAKPEAERLARAEFEIDPGLREMIEQETVQHEEVARLELAWATQKRHLTLAKLRAFYLDPIEVERVVLYAIKTPAMLLTSFRTAKLPAGVQAEVAAIHAAQATAAAAAAAASFTTGDSAASPATRRNTNGQHNTGEHRGGNITRGGLGGTGGTDTLAGVDTTRMTKADLRRLARKRREAEWAVFNATRPDENYENPADVAAIREAEQNMGDYKLKSDPSYVLPEEDRTTPQRKRQQMLLLEEAVHNVKMTFNCKFLALREVKKKVITDISAKMAVLRDISGQLGLKEVLVDPVLRPEETPESRESVGEQDLEEFARRRGDEERKAAAGALGGFATSAAAAQKRGPATAAATTMTSVITVAAATSSSGSGPPVPMLHHTSTSMAGGATSVTASAAGISAVSEDDTLAKMMAAIPQSDMERSLAAYRKKRLEHMRNRLRGEVDDMIEAFDEALVKLRREKFALEADVKLAELKQLVHHQELQLLRDFDKRESVLMQKRQAKMDDRQEILDRITECADKLDARRDELDALMTRRAAVTAEFDETVPETDGNRETLSRIFHKRIKRSKKKSAAANPDDYDSQDEEDEEGDDEDVDDDDDGVDEICPPGCDNALYEKVCDLREKRLDEEDVIGESQKIIEILKKEKEQLAKKQRTVEGGLAAVNIDIIEFQKEKQGRLNQIDVVVNLRMHQIEYLVDGRLPEDLSAGLVFSNKELHRLKTRITELEQEKVDLKGRQKELKKEHLALCRDKTTKEDKVAELEARAYDVQMLKFGQVINMELLDRIGSTKGTEELREELKRQEAQYARELTEWDKKINQRTDELLALTRENTACLNAVSELTAAQRALETNLTQTRKTMFSDPVAQRRKEVEERDQLVQLVNSQAMEIEKLKGQINALKRKDTSVYS